MFGTTEAQRLVTKTIRGLFEKQLGSFPEEAFNVFARMEFHDRIEFKPEMLDSVRSDVDQINGSLVGIGLSKFDDLFLKYKPHNLRNLEYAPMIRLMWIMGFVRHSSA